jgi:hypothetical protein
MSLTFADEHELVAEVDVTARAKSGHQQGVAGIASVREWQAEDERREIPLAMAHFDDRVHLKTKPFPCRVSRKTKRQTRPLLR